MNVHEALTAANFVILMVIVLMMLSSMARGGR
jgi:hypothetical protein